MMEVKPPVDPTFDRAFEYLIRSEGGFSNHRDDSGGPTKYGITLATLEHWRNKECSLSDVQSLTRAEAKTIYQDYYWRPLGLHRVPRLVIATVMFDAAVLFGVSTVTRMAQRILIAHDPNWGLKVDGIMGPRTTAALNQIPQTDFVKALQVELKHRIADIISRQPKNETFRTGWNNRVDRFASLIA